MANKDLFKQAIAEAKSVREAAIANAKEALEETLTPHLKDMLAAKLQEMDAKSEEIEEVVNEEEVEEAMHSKKKDEAMHSKKKDEAHSKDDEKDESIEEAPQKAGNQDDLDEAMDDDEKDEAMHPKKKDEAIEEAPKDDDDAMEEAEDDSEESEDEADDEIEEPAEDEVDGDEELGDLTVDQFKDMIRDIINTEMGGGVDLGADDMDAGDIEGMGDEDPTTGDMSADEPAADDEEIDLDELLAELEATTAEGKHEDDEKMEGKHKDSKDEAMHSKKKDEAMHSKKKDKSMEEETSNQVESESDGANFNVNRTVSEEQLQKELEEALETIEQLKGDLHETNLLNSKLLYVNKIFKANNLNESQKVNIIAAFDKAETVKEVKLVFETVSENVVTTKKEQVSESKVKGIASKATGTAPAKPEVIAEVSDAVRRMQKLAGIIK